MFSLSLESCLFKALVDSFFFNSTATTQIYTLSLHDALPISAGHLADQLAGSEARDRGGAWEIDRRIDGNETARRSEEHTSELQSQSNLVCRLLLEKKKNIIVLSCNHAYLYRDLQLFLVRLHR